jgi:alditol oxidase
MSTAYRRPSLAIHFTWKPEWPAVSKLLPLIEARLEPFAARPHWGKLFSMRAPKIRELYPEVARYQELVARYDAHGKFRNSFLESMLVG